ncbi:MAG: shikimate kinase/3-dehydroquinate synthase [Planctomycetota bacterium]
MADTRIPIDIPHHATALVVGRGAIARLGDLLAAEGLDLAGRQVLVVSDAAVLPHATRVETALRAAGADTARVELVADERRKAMPAVEAVWQAALAARLDRHGLVVAVGGGLVGDLAGFAAATYLRGVAFVQVPTTLLAMVDAAIGGKTGINLPLPDGGLGKNLAGAFWQPRLTVADPDALATLPVRELRAGLAECAKHAVLAGGGRWAQLVRDAAGLREGDAAALDRLVPSSAEVKAAIVARDPLEKGERALLNLGHTFGHAIETLPEIELLHGEAVAIGLAAACATARAGGLLAPGTAVEIVGLLGDLGLPTTLPARAGATVSATEVRRRMGFDKKNAGSRLRLVLPHALGDVRIVEAPPEPWIDAGLASIGCR